MENLYVKYEYWFAAFQLVTAMFGMGAALTFKDFNDILREPKAVIAGNAIQLLLVPLLAFVFIEALGLVGGLAVGIALISAVPGGTSSNIFTYFAKGNVPLSISITGVTTLACLITTPLILNLLITDYLPSEVSMPTGKIVTDIALTLLLPLMIGMIVLQLMPFYAELISRWSIRASLAGLLAIIIGSISSGRLNSELFGDNNFLIILTFTIAVLIIVDLLGKRISLRIQDVTAIEMESTVRNVSLALLVKASIFPFVVGTDNTIGDMILFTILLFGGLQMLAAAGIIYWRRKSSLE